MALIQCPDCGKDISDSAQACIHCGRPMKQAAPKKATEPIRKLPLPPRPSGVSRSAPAIVSHPVRNSPPRGSNAGPAIASLLLPGLGQVLQGREGAAAFWFLASLAVWVLCGMGGLWWLSGAANVFAALDAARWRG